MPAPRHFVVTAAFAADGDRSPLLAAASVLHRRGVHVVEATLGRPAHGRTVFSATFVATSQQAETIVRTLQNQVDVLDAGLYEALDGRGDLELTGRPALHRSSAA